MAIGFTGQNLPFSIQSPALSMNWCIATTGIFPSRP
jgi:microcystin-dependent protein